MVQPCAIDGAYSYIDCALEDAQGGSRRRTGLPQEQGQVRATRVFPDPLRSGGRKPRLEETKK